MKFSIIYLLAVLCMTPVLVSCIEEPLNDQNVTACAEVTETRMDESERGYFSDIKGFDPALQSQLIQMTFPVTVEGVQTNIDAQFSVMPIHIYENNGADKSGDYYVIEADFTAHNAPLKDKNLFMKNLEVSVTPMTTNDDVLTEGTDVFFYDMPSPKTTIMNSTYKDSHNNQLTGKSFIGKAPMWVEKEIEKWIHVNAYPTYSQSFADWQKYLHLQEGHYFLEDVEMNRYEIDLNDIQVYPTDGKVSLIIENGTCDVYGYEIPEELTNVVYKIPNEGSVYSVNINGQTNSIIKLYSETTEGKVSAKVSGVRNLTPLETFTVDGTKNMIWECDALSNPKKIKVPEQNSMCMASFGGGVTWSVDKVYYREDLTTRLNTDSHCGVDYKYVVENLDSSKGIPRVAQSDLNGHATWVWRMPVNGSKFTVEQLLSNLFKMKVEVMPVYGKIGKLDKDISIDAAKSTTMQTSILSAPYRQKMTSIRFTNHGLFPMMNVRLLTVPYLKWVEDGRPESEILLQREDPLMAGESITMPTVETSCYIACEEIDPRSLEVKSVRQSALIDVKIDFNSPQEIKRSTFDTIPVMVYKN